MFFSSPLDEDMVSRVEQDEDEERIAERAIEANGGILQKVFPVWSQAARDRIAERGSLSPDVLLVAAGDFACDLVHDGVAAGGISLSPLGALAVAGVTAKGLTLEPSADDDACVVHDLGGGVAYVDVLCSQNFGYGVSGNMNGNIDWGTWTGTPGSFTWDFVVVAHELGHNFGAQHTHEFCPPIDTCYDNCTGGTSCSLGTLMSYCHTCGGMNSVDIRFHPQISNIMRTNVDQSCLGDATLQAGDTIQYRLRFAPRSGAGVKNATLDVEHDAANAPSPFTINVTGLAQ